MNTLRLSLYGLLGSLILPGPCAAAVPESPEISLAGPWAFAPEAKDRKTDNFAPELDDSAWARVVVPGKWADQGFPHFNGVAWYRRKFTLPESWKDRPLVLNLPPADQSDRVFVNGRLVGATVNKPQLARVYPLPAEAVKFGAENTIAVEVTSKVGRGGFASGEARILSPGPFVPARRASAARPPIPLTADDAAAWKTGWHDPGTADTRIRFGKGEGRAKGESALRLDIGFPNASGEYVDFILPAGAKGSAWQEQGADFLRFWYRTDDLDGEMRLYLNRGNFKFGTGGGGWATSFPVKPGDGWQEVILPFAEFAKRTQKSLTVMPGTENITALSLGYQNNELRGPGTIRFAGFEVGRMPAGPPSTLSLSGLWLFRPDPDAQGHKAGWASAVPAGAEWTPQLPGRPWQAQGFKKYRGPGWFAQQVFVPEDWRGLPLRLRLGGVINRGDNMEVFFNGHPLAATTKWDKDIDTVIPPNQVDAGAMNLAAIYVDGEGANVNGLADASNSLEPLAAWVVFKTRDGAETFADPASFDPGPLPGTPLEAALRVPKICLPAGPLQGELKLVDCFFRTIVEHRGPLEDVEGEPFRQMRVPLDDAQSKRLYFSEFFDLHASVAGPAGEPLLASATRNVALRYDQRDRLALDPLPPAMEDTPYGRLPLVDVIDAGRAPSAGPHPYKEGGIRGSWIGRISYATWEQGVATHEFQGKTYREAANSEWFGYRVGRGKIKPGAAYLVRIEYPEDKTRYMPVNVDAGRNYQGLGFKTGVGPGNPYDDYPLSNGYNFYDLLVIPDAKTYGSAGSRSTPADHGFWIFFYDIGRSYASQYAGGPAVSQIRVYEIPDLEAAMPAIRLPEKDPQRLYIADWEREPEVIPRDVVAHARFLGYNGIAPDILKWGSLAFWHAESLPLKPTAPVRDPLPPDQPGAYESLLDATREKNLKLIPRVEYGGTDAIPKDERAVGANGKPARPNRFASWCADLLRPGVRREIDALFQELIGRHIKDNPQLAGVLLRNRSDRLPISYSSYDVGIFTKDTGNKPPDGFSAAQLAKWASTGEMGRKYADWWQGKRRDFHEQLAADLRAIDPSLRLLFYNWDSDNWNLGKYVRGPADYTDAYNVHTARKAYDRETDARRKITPAQYVDMVRDGREPHNNVRPDLYSGTSGFVLLGPMNWKYLADNPEYLNFFRTGDQLALTKIYNYEEKGRWNVQGDTYESSEMSPGGPGFAMAEQVFAMFHGDPWILTETTYTYGQGFADAHRRFAQAFLALPAIPGHVIPQENQPDLRVRRYDGKEAAYVSAAYRGYRPFDGALRVTGLSAGPKKVTDLVTGETQTLEAGSDGNLVLPLHTGPMSLRSYRID